MKRHSLTLAVLLGIATMAQAKTYDLPSAPLGTTLSRIAADAGITLSFDPAIVRGKTTPQIKGDYTPQQALDIVTAGTGLQLVANGENTYRLIQPNQPTAATSDTRSSNNLAPITVYGEAVALDGLMTDQQGYDAVYDKNYSSDYTGKQRIDTYRGTNPADLLQSFSGIYSGDARNSGAIDPNIRGLQGEGRIKVRVDGTEQAISVYRGYNGASNRNYIDPLLTSNIRIVKDSGLDTGVHTGVGGGIAINTLGVNDFIGEEGGFGGEIRLEGSSNATSPRIGKDYDGTLVKDVPGYSVDYGDNPFAIPKWKQGKSSFLQTHHHKGSGDQFNLFKGQDYAGRIALGYKGTNWDVMGAYAKRSRGNYFSGKHGSGYYSEARNTSQFGYLDDDPVRSLAHYNPPGSEVFNTSNDMTSYLFKVGWQPTEDQSVRLNLRRSETTYGEIMPSRIRANATDDNGIQWPLSTVDLNAYSLQYHFNPKDNRWVDLHTNLWRTDTDSNLYNSGGYINSLNNQGTELEFGDLGFVFGPNGPEYVWNLDKLHDDVLQNNAAIHTKHTRKGFDLSNRMQLADNLALTLGGSFQKENLNSDLKHWPNNDFTQVPRKGQRQEYDLGLNFNWQINDRFSVDVGAKYASYWIHDDFLAEHINDPDALGKGYIATQENYKYGYRTKTPEEKAEQYKGHDYQSYLKTYDSWKAAETPTFHEKDWNPVYDASKSQAENRKIYAKYYEKIYKDHIDNNWDGVEHEIAWARDKQGKLSRANNPCINGTIANMPYVVPKSGDPSICPGSLKTSGTTIGPAEVEKVRDHQWVPSIALNYRLNDDARIYARYNESVRFPSSFEGLMGFSGTRGLHPLRPEHSHKFELGYTHNLLRYFPSAEAADIKLAYYQNRIEDVIDRTDIYKFQNLEEQKIKGLELQARYDNGQFFGDLGLSYEIQNKVCDEHSVAFWEAQREDDPRTASLKRPSVPRCVQDGFYNTFSLTHAVPDFSAKLHLGSRWFDRKLEVGSRMTYYPEMDNKDYDRHLWLLGADPSKGRGQNVAYGWGDTFLIDAYARYKFNDAFSMELSGTNLTDQYFLDPATRTAIPGPGRTVKLSFTGHF